MVGFTLKGSDIDLRKRNGSRGNCLDLFGGLVRSGEFVLFDVSSVVGESKTLAGQIASMEDRRDTPQSELDVSAQPEGEERQRLALVRPLLMVGEARKGLDAEQHNQVPETLHELALTEEASWVPVTAIQSMAFVSHVDSIQGVKCECGGIDNAFAIRKEQRGGLESFEMQEEAFEPFAVPCSGANESYSKRVWNGIAAAKELCFRALSCKGVWDGRNKHVHMIGANYELFQCLQKKTLKQGIESKPMQKKYNYRRAKKRMNSDLSVSNERLKTTVDLVRIVEEAHLDLARRALGSAFAVALTKPVPTLKQMMDLKVSDTVHLRETDIVRIVTCGNDDLDIDSKKDVAPCPVLSETEAPQAPSFDAQQQESIDGLKRAKRCPFPGLELEHQRSETGLTDLHIHIIFKKLLGKSRTVRKAQRGGRLTRAAARKNSYTCAIGDELMWNEKVCSTVTLLDGKVGCAVSGKEKLGATIELDKQQAGMLVDNFLGG